MPSISLPSKEQIDKLIKPPLEVTLLNNASTVSDGATVIVDGYNSMVLEVTGDFVGEIWIREYVDSTQGYGGSYPVIKDGVKYASISKPGRYYVDITGIKSLRARLNSVTSGTAKVYARILTSSLNPSNLSNFNKRIHQIESKTSITVAAGQTLEIFNLIKNELENFAYIWIGVVPVNSTIDVPYELKISWLFTPTTQFVLDQLLISDKRRNITDWLEVKTPMATIKLTNKDTIDKDFRIAIYGVR